jgi:hypothetical protein
MNPTPEVRLATSKATDCFHVSQHFDAFLVACAPCIEAAITEAVEQERARVQEKPCRYCAAGNKVETGDDREGWHVLEWYEGYDIQKVFCMDPERIRSRGKTEPPVEETT